MDDERYAWLKESAAVMQIWRAAMRTVSVLSLVFLPRGIPDEEPSTDETDRWRHRYRAALQRLREAGITTTSDVAAGEEGYLNLRAHWDRYIAAFADHMMHTTDVIDPIGTNPKAVASERPDFTERLRAVG